jgi:hypothetical protein
VPRPSPTTTLARYTLDEDPDVVVVGDPADGEAGL